MSVIAYDIYWKSSGYVRIFDFGGTTSALIKVWNDPSDAPMKAVNFWNQFGWSIVVNDSKVWSSISISDDGTSLTVCAIDDGADVGYVWILIYT